MNWLLRTAFWLALAPLLLGIGIYLLWRGTAWNVLMPIGGVVMLGGIVATVLAGGLLGWDWWRARREGQSARCASRRVGPIALLALANYPAGLLVIVCVSRDLACYSVTVQNHAAEPWSKLVLEGGGERRDLGTLAAHTAVQVDLWFEADGQLVLRAGNEALPQTTIVEGYVTHSMGGGAVVVRGADGRVQVSPRPR